MNYYLGIDIGTSGTKTVCFNENGIKVKDSYATYKLYNLKEGYAEENPKDWFNAVCKTIKDITKSGYKIKGIGLSGQMHGLCLLDKDDNLLRNSIIWCDNRAYKEKDILSDKFGSLIKEKTGNDVIASFTLSKLLWVKNNEPEIYKKINKICLPKDYVRYMLTNEFKSEYSDTSGTQLLDIYNKTYIKELLDYLEINENMLPKLIESSDISGYINKDLLNELGLDSDCFIVGGAGDQAACAIGNGIISKNDISIVLGSSGVIFNPINKDDIKNTKNLQVFMHAVKDTYHIMGVTNGCGLSYKWWKENIGLKSYNELNDEIDLYKDNNLIYLPYINGERTPILDRYASGTFIGIRQSTTMSDMTKAILEGVSFSLKDCFSLLPKDKYNIKVTGGGANSSLWKTIIASTLNQTLLTTTNEESGTLGVAILAMVAAKEYNDINDACLNIIKTKEKTKPDEKLILNYEKKFKLYKKAYASLKHYYKLAYKGDK